MIGHRIRSTRSFAVKCMRHFGSSEHFPSQPFLASGEDKDNWNNWEFGSFATKKHRNTEKSVADKASHGEGKEKSRIGKNIDNDWSYLSDEEVEVGILALKVFSTASRIDKLEAILEKRTANIRLVFVSTSNADSVNTNHHFSPNPGRPT